MCENSPSEQRIKIAITAGESLDIACRIRRKIGLLKFASRALFSLFSKLQMNESHTCGNQALYLSIRTIKTPRKESPKKSLRQFIAITNPPYHSLPTWRSESLSWNSHLKHTQGSSFTRGNPSNDTFNRCRRRISVISRRCGWDDATHFARSHGKLNNCLDDLWRNYQ